MCDVIPIRLSFQSGAPCCHRCCSLHGRLCALGIPNRKQLKISCHLWREEIGKVDSATSPRRGYCFHVSAGSRILLQHSGIACDSRYSKLSEDCRDSRVYTFFHDFGTRGTEHPSYERVIKAIPSKAFAESWRAPPTFFSKDGSDNLSSVQPQVSSDAHSVRDLWPLPPGGFR